MHEHNRPSAASADPVGNYMSPLTASVGSDQVLSTAAAKMEADGIRHLPVLTGGDLVGILSERDVMWLRSLSIDSDELPVSEAMSDPVHTVAPTESVLAVVEVMAEKKFGSVVIVEHGKPTGIFTTTDVLRLCAKLLRPR